jgi:hypothetical protein
MPRLTRWTIRLGLGYVLTGLALWILYEANQQGHIGGTWYALRPVSIHFITVGWLTQLIFAVIFWMFPIMSRERPYGAVWLSWFGFTALNLGLILRAVFEIGLSQGWPADSGWGLVGSALLQWSGVSALVFNSWGRIRPRGGR